MTTDFDHGQFRGEVLTKLDALKEMGEKVCDTLEKHDVRLRVLEDERTRLKVYMAIGCAAIAAGTHKLMALWK